MNGKSSSSLDLLLLKGKWKYITQLNKI